jgi:hypothetical protein
MYSAEDQHQSLLSEMSEAYKTGDGLDSKGCNDRHGQQDEWDEEDPSCWGFGREITESYYQPLVISVSGHTDSYGRDYTSVYCITARQIETCGLRGTYPYDHPSIA